jgi:hypothetical protein
VTRAAAALAAATCALALTAASVEGQALLTQPQRAFLTTDVLDGRALWLQPAGLVRRREASVGLAITAEQRGGTTRLAEYGATLASGGFGLGWQRAELVDATHVSQWAIGYGAGGPRASLGVARRWLKGERVNDAVWDVGGRFVPRPFLEVSAVWRDIGTAVVRSSDTAQTALDTTYSPTLVPGAALTLFGGRARLGAEAELLTSGWKRRAARAGAAVVLAGGLGLHVRAGFDGDLAFEDLAVAVTWSPGRARVSAFGAFPQGGGARHAGLWGAAVRDLERRTPGFR